MIQERLLVPQVQDVGRYISAYFEQLYIRRGESIQEYVTRERLVYVDMCRAVKALNQSTSAKVPSRTTSVRADDEYWGEEDDGDDDLDEVWPNVDQDYEDQRGRPKGKGKGGKGSSRPTSNKSEWSIVSDAGKFELDDASHDEMLPDQILGYFLLRRAGLSKLEEQQVMSSANNSLKRDHIEAALRALFWDKRSSTGRQGHYSSSQWEDDGTDYAPMYGMHGETDWQQSNSEWGNSDWEVDSQYGADEPEDVPLDDLDEEDKSAFLGAADNLRQGLAQFKQGKRTMTQARALMKEIRVSRGFKGKGKGKGSGKLPGKGPGKIQALAAALLDSTGYYGGKGKSGGKGKGFGKGKTFGKGFGKGRTPGNLTPRRVATADDACFLCGDRGHFSRDCPHGSSGHYGYAEDDWEDDWPQLGYAAFRISWEDPDSLETACHSGFSSSKLVPNRPGLAPIDSGATDSFGGGRAIREFKEAYQVRYGLEDHTGEGIVKYDLEDNPSFTFGAGNVEKSPGRADVRVWSNDRPARLAVHEFPKAESVPILVGNTSLDKLGAVVDFSTGACIFTKIDAESIRVLPRNLNGHLCLDLLEDLSRQGEFLCTATEAISMPLDSSIRALAAVARSQENVPNLNPNPRSSIALSRGSSFSSFQIADSSTASFDI